MCLWFSDMPVLIQTATCRRVLRVLQEPMCFKFMEEKLGNKAKAKPGKEPLLMVGPSTYR